MPKIDNIKVYGLKDAIGASKFPMSINVAACDDELTERVKSLGHAPIGSGHDNFLKGIIVQFDLTFSQNAWQQLQRYHFIDFISSQSKMHKITKLDLKKQCNKYVDSRIIDIVQAMINEYNRLAAMPQDESVHNVKARKEMMEELYLHILYNIPCGFELTAAMTTNYQQLKTIYSQRRNHRLPDWKILCDEIEKLPMWKELVG